MKFRTTVGSILFLFLTIMITGIRFVHSAETTTVYINPKYGQSFIGQSFIINVTIANVTNLSNWQLVLSFDPRILNCTQIFDPATDPDNIFAGYSIIWPVPEINNTGGLIRCFCALDVPFGVDGSGNLCQIEFKSLTLGVSSLDFIIGEAATYIRDPNNVALPFQAISGIVEVIAPGLELYTFDVTQNGETYQVAILSNSTVTSLSYNETLIEISFDVTGPDGTVGYCSVTTPKKLLNDTVTVLIDDAASCHLSKSFNTLPENATHCYPCFTYNHSTRNVKIRATVPGDINGDRKTNIRDISTVARAFGSYPGHPRWNPVADINRDGKVNIRDIAMVARNFGNEWGIL